MEENKYLVNVPISIENIDFTHVNDNLPRYGEGFDYNGEKSIYCVYMHVNKTNGKKYVGITLDLKRRWKGQGSEYKKSPYFYRAIQKYTWNGFDHLLLLNGLTKSMAEQIEIQLIKKYHTHINNGKEGYNLTNGGEGVTSCSGLRASNKKEVFAYNPDGTFYKSWPLIKFALKELQRINGEQIRKVIKGKQELAFGYQWRDKYCGEKIEPVDIYQNKIYRNIPIVRLSGNKQITYYNDIYDIDNSYTIARVKYAFWKNKHSACDYLWFFKNDFDKNLIDTYLKESDIRCVYQYDLDGNFIKSYSSPLEASKITGFGIEGITSCCSRINKSHMGYQWRYSFDSDDIEKYNNERKYTNMKVYQISDDYEILNVYDDIYSIPNNETIINKYSQLLNKKLNEYHRFHNSFWFFEKDYLNGNYKTIIDSYKKSLIKPKVLHPICCYDKEGNLVAEYSDVSNVPEVTKAQMQYILEVAKNKKGTTGGFQWRFKEDEAPGKFVKVINYKTKKVAKIDKNTNQIIQIYNRIKDVEKEYGKDSDSLIVKVCKGKNKSAYGYLWRYLDENNNIIEPLS